MESIWISGVERPRFESLNHDVKTDVLVVGGGIAGILCTYMLKKSGVDCVLVEANRIGCGITQNTTAKITCQHGLIYDKMIKRFGSETAKLYFEAQNEALAQYKDICNNIECDFKECDSYVYSIKNRQRIELEAEALQKIGCNAFFKEQISLPLSVVGAVGIAGQAQFHPLKFLYSISKNLSIFENTKVLEFAKNHVVTDKGKIRAKKIIVATHFPILNKHGSYFLKMYQHRSYVIALKNVPDIDDMYVDEDIKGLSFRGYKNFMLLGGGSHRTGKKGGAWDELNVFAKKYYENSEVVSRFATQDCMTLDDIPYIGQYSQNTPSLFVATGFNKWGMTSAMTSALILKDLVLEKENKYSKIFSPSRNILRPQLAINIAESLLGVLTPTTPRCPHMGCALKYNKNEHSRDCSCHGSRFRENGELIDNPACDDLKNIKS